MFPFPEVYGIINILISYTWEWDFAVITVYMRGSVIMGESGFDAQILDNQRNKYRNLNEVYDLTKEIDRAFSEGDAPSLEMLLDMRQKKMEMCVKFDNMNFELLDQLSDEQKNHYMSLIVTKNMTDSPEPVDESEETIYTMTKRIRAQMLKTIEYNKAINERFAGV